jgi:phosphoglycolate phosphatase
MKYKVFVFDFDGTLVDSVNLKINAYFKIFQPYSLSDSLISSVLKEFPDLNRYDTIQVIIDRGKLSANATALSELYTAFVLDEILRSPYLEFATEILNFLQESNYSVYLSSNTPQVVLDEIIEKMKWKRYFNAIFGYPHLKIDTLKRVIGSGNYPSSSVLVIGDGDSDKKSAELNDTDFFRVEGNSLFPLIKYLNIGELINVK